MIVLSGRTFVFTCVIICASLSIITYTGLIFRVAGHLPQSINFDNGAVHGFTEAETVHRLREPRFRFRENLRNDSYYITSWAGAGYTNQFISHVNMIYLGLLADRIPIIAPFAPTPHILDADLWMLPFGDIYDLDRLSERLRIPILEWRDVKIFANQTDGERGLNPSMEEVGCWTTAPEAQKSAEEPARLPQYLGVDCSYTYVPHSARLHREENEDQRFVALPKLAAAIYPVTPSVRAEGLHTLQKSRIAKHGRTPDVQLSCFDSLYYSTTGTYTYEWEKSWGFAWNMVGRHLHYTPKVKAIGEEYVRRALGVQASKGEFPPFIALHIRHGDFGEKCARLGKAKEECFPPISAYVTHVEAIQKKWMEQSTMSVSNVIVMSDEESPDFWDDVKRQGWSFSNHTAERTVERFGGWYPTIIDTVIQSLAVGHVGTTSSTFTLVGERRVKDWNKGFTSSIHSRLF